MYYIYVWFDFIWFDFDLIWFDWLIDLVDWLLIIISFWRHPLTGKATASWVEMVVVYDAGIGTCHWRESTVSFVPCYSFKILQRCPAWNWSSLWPKWCLHVSPKKWMVSYVFHAQNKSDWPHWLSHMCHSEPLQEGPLREMDHLEVLVASPEWVPVRLPSQGQCVGRSQVALGGCPLCWVWCFT